MSISKIVFLPTPSKAVILSLRLAFSFSSCEHTMKKKWSIIIIIIVILWLNNKFSLEYHNIVSSVMKSLLWHLAMFSQVHGSFQHFVTFISIVLTVKRVIWNLGWLLMQTFKAMPQLVSLQIQRSRFIPHGRHMTRST